MFNSLVRELLVIEAEVHQQLRAFLREQGEPHWHHHLTMARLVARALRLGRNALIQTGIPAELHGRYRLSYLMPALLWPEPTILVVPQELQQRLLLVDLPRLREWLPSPKPIQTGDRFPYSNFQGLLITTPESWLRDRLNHEGRFPAGIPTILDGADDLETLARQVLTAHLPPTAWDELMLAHPEHIELIRDSRVRLTHAIFQHPPNPYDCFLLEAAEITILQQLLRQLAADSPLPQPEPQVDDRKTEELRLGAIAHLPHPWHRFAQHCTSENRLIWADVNRQYGHISLHGCPAELALALEPIWTQQPLVLIGGAVDLEPEAPIYRQRLGLGDVTCLKFCPDRQQELIQLYLPDGLPLPNTPQFQPALLSEIRGLLGANTSRQGLTVVLVGDVPLKSQVASALAAEYGSRVQVEKTQLDEHGILVTGWEFWRNSHTALPAPQLLIVTTLPIPSLEDPLIAGRVNYYKRHRQDWFRLFLLPNALSELQRAIAPMRESQGVVALLDNRVNYRSYGKQVLAALTPLARINYIDASLFTHFDCTPID
ncbi:helicase C-terminal domain-containing protein [Leptolyngbya sp. AN02str]|uniref:helicase C-terminal domain-containing protein n=1 Tax=Leptolyngbya sp. AN02str TaxID=3423363 RepID=UPI003D322C9A